MAKTSKIKISELIQDDLNFNKGTELGSELIKKSFGKFGAGRSILLDKNNKIIAGNKSTENATLQGIEDVIIIETTGQQLVAVKRIDIDLDSDEGKEMALADNATSLQNINWDLENLEKWNNDSIIDDWIIDNHANEFFSTEEIPIDEKLDTAEELGIENDYLMIVFRTEEEFENCKELFKLKRQVENKGPKSNNEGIQRIIHYEDLRAIIE